MSRTATVLLACGALAGGLALAEASLRMSHLVSVTGLATVRADEFDRIPGMFSPTAAFDDRRESRLPHRVSVNSLGYRGEDFPRDKPDGEFRILHLGDSFTFGDFVDDDETLPAQLQARLRMSCPNIRVINAGLPGSTITEQQEILTRARSLAPDLVLLSFTENDVADLTTVSMWEQLRENRQRKSGFPLGMVYPLLRHTALWNLAMKLRGKYHMLANSNNAPSPGPRGALPVVALRARYAQLLTAMAAGLQREQLPLVFTLFPAHQTLYARSPAEQLNWVSGVARSAGVPVISTLPVLRADGRDQNTLYLLPDDGHPSAAGYGVAAREIARVLLTTDRLAAHCYPAPRT